MCYPVCGMVHIKDPLLLIENSSLCSGDSGFLCHITVNKMCSVHRLMKHFIVRSFSYDVLFIEVLFINEVLRYIVRKYFV